MRLVFASDTHSLHGSVGVPDGDAFVHCGDFTMHGTLAEIRSFGRWIRALPHASKIVVAGNHDLSFERDSQQAREALLEGTDEPIYLQDDGIAIGGVTFYGSPWQPWFYDWAFNLQRGEALAQKWSRIPNDTDVLVTHGPPNTILDTVNGEHVGCADLLDRIGTLRPLVHAFGHIHEGSGVAEREGTIFVNASICDASYRARNPCRVVDIDPRRRRAAEACA